jgi:hypothetical protein
MGGPDVQRKCCNCVTAAAWGPQERKAPPDVAFGRERIGRIELLTKESRTDIDPSWQDPKNSSAMPR